MWGVLLFAGDGGKDPVNVSEVGGSVSVVYGKTPEHVEIFSAASIAVAVSDVVAFAGSATMTEKFPELSAVVVAAGVPVQVPLRYIETVEFASAVPMIDGDVVLDGDGGDAPVITGAAGGVMSMTNTVGELPLCAPTPITIKPVVAPTGTTASTRLSLIKTKLAGFALKVTAPTPVKNMPLIWTEVPGFPTVGEKLVITGAVASVLLNA